MTSAPSVRAKDQRVLWDLVIEMYFVDHAPPHFHARYSGDEATIVIATGEVLERSLRPRALRLVREWLSDHRMQHRSSRDHLHAIDIAFCDENLRAALREADSAAAFQPIGTGSACMR